MKIKTKQNLLFLGILAFFYFSLIFGLPTILAQAGNLTAYWTLDENSGITAADSAGSNTGTLVSGPSWTTGKYNSALLFDGTDDYVDLGTSDFNLTDSLTVSAWVKVSSTNGSYATIIGRGQYLYPFWLQLDSENKVRFGIRTTATSYLTTDTHLDTGQWYHLAATYQNGERIIYINGQPSKSDAPAGTLYQRSGEKTFLGNTPNTTTYFNGTIDDVRIYNRALSAQEISDLYNNPPTTPVAEPPACTPDWYCDTWTNCQPDSSQTRICIDSNTCDTTANKPAESQSCIYIPPAGNIFYINANSECTSNCTGTTWSNAPKTLPSTLTRGATYYIATGSYGGYTFDDSENGTQYITIKKATVADHGSPAGWNAGYDNGPAVFSSSVGNTLTFLTGYYVFDGQVGGGPENWKTGHGFKLTNTDPNTSHVVHIITMKMNSSTLIQQPSNLVFKHIEMVGRNPAGPTDDFIYAWGYDDYTKVAEACPGGCGTRNLTLSYSYLHNIGRDFILMMHGQNYLFEYNYFTDQSTNPNAHGAGIESFGDDNVTIRYNVFANVSGTGFLDLKKNYNDTSENWYVYGNVFYYTPDTAATGVGNAVFNSTSLKPFTQYPRSGECNNMNFYNNDIINLHNGTLNAGIYFTAGNNNKAYNNIWYGNMAHQIGFTNVVHDYNGFYANACSEFSCSDATFLAKETHPRSGSIDPFVNFANLDFNLRTQTNAGRDDLGSPYNLDMFGKTRGLDGIWDLGAVEFSSSTPPPACTPNCSGKTCGSDGCGGVCGSCSGGSVCGANNQCVCTPNWSCIDWSICSIYNFQIRTCTDLNACGVSTNKPLESQGCTYTPPVNNCTPNWSCNAWSGCNPSRTQTRSCTDTNHCNTDSGRLAESQACTYTAPIGGGGGGGIPSSIIPSPITDLNATTTPQTQPINDGTLTPLTGGLSADSDNDGLSDEQEATLGTDPNNVDTDYDSYNDKEEVDSGYNPLTPTVIRNVNQSLLNRLKGYILLQVQRNGEAWYVHPFDGLRYYLRNGDIAYQIMRFLSLGITDADLAKIPEAGSSDKGDTNLINRLKGYILLQVQQHGEAWYVNPFDGKRYYMKDGPAAYELMRFHSLGITNADLNTLPIGELKGKIK